MIYLGVFSQSFVLYQMKKCVFCQLVFLVLLIRTYKYGVNIEKKSGMHDAKLVLFSYGNICMIIEYDILNKIKGFLCSASSAHYSYFYRGSLREN